jgi:hypothetical protein
MWKIDSIEPTNSKGDLVKVTQQIRKSNVAERFTFLFFQQVLLLRLFLEISKILIDF